MAGVLYALRLELFGIPDQGEEREHQEGAIVIIEGLSALALPDELRGRASLQTNEVQ